MNFIQKNPDDPRYAEFHDGEYEYWSTEGSVKSKSISIPAALASGLELLAAAAATGLLAVALATLYVVSAPRAIGQNSAMINTNVYNNMSNDPIAYSLHLAADPDIIWEEGMLEDNEDILHLHNLSSGTTYLLKYFDPDQNEIGQFRFTTDGEPDPLGDQEPPQPEQIPEPPEPTAPTAETQAATEPGTEPTESTQETTVPEKDPPHIVYPRPTPRPEQDPEDDKKPEQTLPLDPESTLPVNPQPSLPEDTEPTLPTGPNQKRPTASEPDMGDLKFFPPDISGDEVEAYFRYEEYHTFQDVTPDYSISILQGNTAIENPDVAYDPDSSVLRVSFVGGKIPAGSPTTTVVTVTTGSGTAASTQTVFPPSFDSVELTGRKTGENTYTFDITAKVVSDDTQRMDFDAKLYVNKSDGTGVTVPLTFDEGTNTYIGSHTASFASNNQTEQAMVDVYAYWSMIGAGVYSQNRWSISTIYPNGTESGVVLPDPGIL